MGANHFGNKLFITIPRRRPGIPATVNYIPMNSSNTHNVPLIPYPDFEINQIGKGNLNSVYRVTVDDCGRLWMVDTGLLEYPGMETISTCYISVLDCINIPQFLFF